MSHESTGRIPLPWHEVAIDEFEAVVDTNAFEAMMRDYQVEDKISCSFDSLTVDVDDLPNEITESHYFPRRFNIERFEAAYSQYTVENDEDQWQLTAQYVVNGQDYFLVSDSAQTTLKTAGYEGSELTYRFGTDTAVRFLASVAAIQLNVSQSSLSGFFERSSEVSPTGSIPELLRLIGTRDESSLFVRNRLGWLPLLEDGRALVVDYGEMETSARSGRKLKYKMAWQIADATTEISSYQSEFAGHGAITPYFSQRSHVDFRPDELLFLHQLGQPSGAGEYVDADTEREQHAYIANTLMFVLKKYLEPYGMLDAPIDLEEEGEKDR